MFVETKKEGEAPSQFEPWRQLLLNAADYIEIYGWCQNQRSLDGRVCAIGAIEAVAYGQSKDAARRALIEYLGECIVVWNDAPGQTEVEVVAAMRDCARS